MNLDKHIAAWDVERKSYTALQRPVYVAGMARPDKIYLADGYTKTGDCVAYLAGGMQVTTLKAGTFVCLLRGPEDKRELRAFTSWFREAKADSDFGRVGWLKIVSCYFPRASTWYADKIGLTFKIRREYPQHFEVFNPDPRPDDPPNAAYRVKKSDVIIIDKGSVVG